MAERPASAERHDNPVLTTDVISCVSPTHFWYGATGLDLVDGLRLANWDIEDIDLLDFFIKRRSKLGRAIARLIEKPIEAAFNHAILAAAEQYRAQVMLTVQGAHISRATLRELGRRGVLRVNFYPDFHFDHNGFDEALLEDYDLVTTTKSFQIKYLENKLGSDRVAFVPHGYSELVHRADRPITREDEYLWDISYIGNASQHKRDWLLSVAEAFPDASMLVIGNGWERLSRGTALEKFVLGHSLTGDFFARVIERSRINLAVHHGKVRSDGWEDLLSRRSFEIPAYGGFLLHIDNWEIREIYEVGREVDVFDSAASLRERIAFYLSRPALRREMIGRAYARCVPAYSIHGRARTIDRLVRQKLAI